MPLVHNHTVIVDFISDVSNISISMRYVDDTVFVLDTREGLQSWGTAAKIEI